MAAPRRAAPMASIDSVDVGRSTRKNPDSTDQPGQTEDDVDEKHRAPVESGDVGENEPAAMGPKTADTPMTGPKALEGTRYLGR